MITIYKYPIPLPERAEVVMPKGAVVHQFACQGSANLFVWAKVDTEETELETHIFHIRGTGQDLGDAANFPRLATVFDGLLVWHVFREKVVAS